MNEKDELVTDLRRIVDRDLGKIYDRYGKAIQGEVAEILKIEHRIISDNLKNYIRMLDTL